MVNTLALLAVETPSVGFVCFLGIMVVFIGLACIIGVISLMNASVARAKASEKKPDRQTPAEPTAKAPAAPIQNREEIIAAVCAAVAEENGTDISAIRVISFKKIN